MSLLSRLRNSTILTSDPGEEKPGQGFVKRVSEHLDKAIDTISDRFNMASGVLNMRTAALLTAGAVLMVTTGCGGAPDIDENIELNTSEQKIATTQVVNSLETNSKGIAQILLDDSDNVTVQVAFDNESVFGEGQRSFSGAQDISPQQKEVAERLLEKYEDSFGGKVQFEVVENAEDANISVALANLYPTIGNSDLPGFGNPKADITIDDDAGSDLEVFVKVLLHELNHAVVGANDLLPNSRKSIDMQDGNRTVDGQAVGSVPNEFRNTRNSVMAYGQPSLLNGDNDVTDFELEKLTSLPYDQVFIDAILPGDQGSLDNEGVQLAIESLKNKFDENKAGLIPENESQNPNNTVELINTSSPSPG